MKYMMLSPSGLFLTSLLLVGTVLPVAAQEVDPQWRVINNTPASVVPLYQGQPSPFPAMKLEVKDEEQDQREIQRQEAINLANKSKSEIEAMMKSPTVFLPDVSGLIAHAYMKGGRGNMALIGGRWYAENTAFEVPNFKNPAILSKINYLSKLDSQMADMLMQQLSMQHRLHPKSRLQIKSIDSKQVVFSGPSGDMNLPIRQNVL